VICIPITASTTDEAIRDMKKGAEIADILELRIDYIRDLDIAKLIKEKSKPVIVTPRSQKEGGRFKGSEEERAGLLREAVRLGAEYIDIEFSTDERLRKGVIEESRGTKVIVSYHNFTETPSDIKELYDDIAISGGDIIKIVTFANSINDNLVIFDLIKGHEKRKDIISFCMGRHGEISRILSPIIGGYLTFGSLEEGKESASGQIPARVLKSVYRVDRLGQEINIYGLVGNPVSESMGYLIHNLAFAELDLDNIYLPFLVEDINSFMTGFKGLFKGLSVTMPFKEEVIDLLDGIDKKAEDIGAVNTVVVKDDKLVGYNTDCSGAIMALEDRTEIKGKNAVMIGAGGVARAIGFGVKGRGGILTITDIDTDKAISLSKDIGCKYCNPDELGNISMDIFINTTPVGMYPDVDRSPVPDSLLKEGMIVFDAVYNPIKTRLLKEAEAKGCITIPGVEMFINQGVAQFEMWTKREAPVDIMREIVLNKISA